MRSSIILNTFSLAIRIGRAVLEARRLHEDPGEAVVCEAGGRRYIRGKVVDVERRATRGFANGRLLIDGLDDDAGRRVEIDFQNENLVNREGERVPVTVPDLITLVTTDEGEPITTELVRYGLRADVLVIPCRDLLKTPEALEVVGPGPSAMTSTTVRSSPDPRRCRTRAGVPGSERDPSGYWAGGQSWTDSSTIPSCLAQASLSASE